MFKVLSFAVTELQIRNKNTEFARTDTKVFQVHELLSATVCNTAVFGFVDK